MMYRIVDTFGLPIRQRWFPLPEGLMAAAADESVHQQCT